MHDHDPDLVATLAEGTLGDEQARAAEASIAGCPRCTADLTAQRRALEAIAELRGATLTASERTDLRSAVAEAINLELSPAPAPVTEKRSRRRIPWPSVAVAALSVLAVVAVVPLVGTLTTSDDDAASTIGLALSTTVPEAEEESLTAARVPEDTFAEAPAAAGDGADADESQLAADPDTTLAATSDVLPGATRADDARVKALLEDPEALFAEGEPAPGRCAEQAEAAFDTLDGVLVATVPLADGEGIAYFTSVDDAIERLVLFETGDCRIVGDSG